MHQRPEVAMFSFAERTRKLLDHARQMFAQLYRPSTVRGKARGALPNHGGSAFGLRPVAAFAALLVTAAVAVMLTTAGDASAQDVIPEVSVFRCPAAAEGKGACFHVLASPRPARDLVVQLHFSERGKFAAAGQLGRRSVTVRPSRSGFTGSSTLPPCRRRVLPGATAGAV